MKLVVEHLVQVDLLEHATRADEVDRRARDLALLNHDATFHLAKQLVLSVQPSQWTLLPEEGSSGTR